MRFQTRAGRAALLGILCALAVALSFLEGLLPALPIPGAKWGFSNLVTMFAIGSLGLPSALAVTVVKAAFALLRGPTAAALSLAGGLLSMLVMWSLWRLSRGRLSYIGIGIAGAVAHNGGQLAMAAVLLGGGVWAYTPWLLLCAAVSGTATGLILNLLLPLLRRKWGQL